MDSRKQLVPKWRYFWKNMVRVFWSLVQKDRVSRITVRTWNARIMVNVPIAGMTNPESIV